MVEAILNFPDPISGMPVRSNPTLTSSSHRSSKDGPPYLLPPSQFRAPVMLER
jgi:hypothetical protein